MAIFPLAPDQTIAQMWSNGARGEGHFGTTFKEEGVDQILNWSGRDMGLSYAREIVSMWAQCMNVTDKQTDHGTVT